MRLRVSAGSEDRHRAESHIWSNWAMEGFSLGEPVPVDCVYAETRDRLRTEPTS